jgi:pyruvate/2-oxoglutarate dehydrogenase complex dihydrolipoamide dehydrogenase (E3) component/uncharacterized membrane protein YdjX (TVP38/TMEM64 family)
MEVFDAIVIGAGSGGLTAAIGLNKIGKKVLLVEKNQMGGECTNTGCIPSKHLIHLASEYAVTKKYNVAGKKPDDFRKSIPKRVRSIIEAVRQEESEETLKKMGIKVVIGKAEFVDKSVIRVGRKQFKAKHIIIATGSRPKTIEIPGLEKARILTNENLFELKTIPEHLIMIGGGAVSAEMAQAFAKLGSKVTMVVRGERILSKEEPEISELTEKRFSEMGIQIHTQSTLKKCHKKTCVIALKNGHKKEVPYDYVLQAIGRKPNTQDLKLNRVGIRHDEKGIIVNQHYRTNVRNVYAIGDVSGIPKFTHAADDQARHVVRKILIPVTRREDKPIPRVTFMEEEVAAVGLTHEEAIRRYGAKAIIKLQIPYAKADRSKTEEASYGTALVIAKRLSGRVLGAGLMGKNAGELIHVFTMAIQYGISLWKINKLIFPYPTMGQIIKKISDTFIAESARDLKKDLWHLFKKHLPKLIALIFWTAILATFWQTKKAYQMSSLELIKEFYRFITQTEMGPLIYISAYALRPVILFPASLLTLVSGALFGFWWGVFFTVIGANLSANFAYLIGRILGKDLINEHEKGFFNAWKRRLKEKSFLSVLIMRLIYLPFDLVNYACGFFHIKWPAYALATLIGMLPGLVTFVSFGSSIENISEFNPSMISLDKSQFIISILLFLSSLGIARLVKRWNTKTH